MNFLKHTQAFNIGNYFNFIYCTFGLTLVAVQIFLYTKAKKLSNLWILFVFILFSGMDFLISPIDSAFLHIERHLHLQYSCNSTLLFWVYNQAIIPWLITTLYVRNYKKIEDFDEYHLLVQEVANLKDDLLRNRADLENFKRRNNEERIRERKYALQDFLMELIDVIDIYDKAVSVKTDDEKLNKFLSGFIMINNRLKQILEHYEVKQIDALNKPFDPSFHSAIEAIKVDGVEPNTVVEVIITGYTYKDRVLRPSMVKVSE